MVAIGFLDYDMSIGNEENLTLMHAEKAGCTPERLTIRKRAYLTDIKKGSI